MKAGGVTESVRRMRCVVVPPVGTELWIAWLRDMNFFSLLWRVVVDEPTCVVAISIAFAEEFGSEGHSEYVEIIGEGGILEDSRPIKIFDSL